MEFIDKIIYINLDSREDRKKEIEEQFARVGIPSNKIERFSALRHPNSNCAGCNLSHATALRRAYEAGYQNVLILEDDFNFINDIELIYNSLKRFFEEIDGAWDAVLLTFGNQESKPHSDLISKLTSAKNAAAYLVNRKQMLELSNLIYEAAEPLASTNMHWVYQNDIIWQKCMKNNNWYHFNKRLGYQRAGFSDLSQCVRDYTDNGI
jgi:glycosyl transferase family 25